MSVSHDTFAIARRQYLQARDRAGQNMPVTTFHLGAQLSAMASGSGPEPDNVFELAIGSHLVSQRCFKHRPPLPAELEDAIMLVEDEVMRAKSVVAAGSWLSTTDVIVREIARIAGLADQPEMVIALSAVELTFQRLAAVASGRPASVEGIPDDASFAAALLILREFMHHLGFESITVAQA